MLAKFCDWCYTLMNNQIIISVNCLLKYWILYKCKERVIAYQQRAITSFHVLFNLLCGLMDIGVFWKKLKPFMIMGVLSKEYSVHIKAGSI